jgi:sugar phosphate isomerase/epimerase
MRISTNCELVKSDIENKIKSIKKSGFTGIEIPVTSYDRVDSVNLKNYRQIKKLIYDLKIEVVSTYKLCGWFELDGELMGIKTDNWQDIKREIEVRMQLSKEIGSNYIICVPSYSNRNHFANIEEGISRYREIIDISKKYDINPVVEFMGQTKQINTLSKCLDFLNFIDNSQKYVLDTYHVWRGTGTVRDIFDLKDPSRLAVVHVADANESISRNIHRDKDRPMPGDGFINLNDIIKHFKNIGYDGYFSLGCYLYSDNENICVDSVCNEAYKKLSELLI